MSRAALLAGMLLVATGCMTQTQRIESVSGPVRTTRGPPLAGSERVYVLVLPRTDQLELRVRAEAVCSMQQELTVARTEVREHRASGARFIGAAAAFLGGSMLLSGPGSDALGASVIGAGTLVVVVPMLAEHEERKTLPPELRADPGPSTVHCADHPLRDARVAVRLGARTLEATSDAAGRVRFRDDRPTPEMRIFVNDVAVPVRVGAPPGYALPDAADPAGPSPAPP